MDVLIPEIRNSSSTSAADRDNVTTNLTTMVFDDDAMRNCTPLYRVDLVDVFAKMDVGSTEFWGSSSVVWMTFFIMYCILFYAALFSVFFYWGYTHIGLVYSSYCFRIHRRNLFLSAPSHWLRPRIRRVSYLLALQILWFVFSFVHGILIISSVASGSDNDVVAVATRTIETVTSFSFVNIIITAALLFSNPYFSVIWMVWPNLIIYLLGMVIIFISLVGDSATLIVVLIILRSLMFIANAAIFVTLLRNKKYNISNFLRDRIGRRLVLFLYFMIFLYFLISYSYFLYTLSTVASNSNCIENVQLHRVVWLVLNFSLRICEVSLLILQFTNTRRLLTTLSSSTISTKARSVHSCVDHGTSKVSNF